MTLDKLRDLATHAKPEATFSPSTVLALLDRLKKAEEALVQVNEYGPHTLWAYVEKALAELRKPLDPQPKGTK